MTPFLEFLPEVSLTPEPAQRIFWGVVDGMPPNALEGDDRELARSIFGDVEEVPEDALSTVVPVKGADVGFTTLGAYWLLHGALSMPLGDAMPGEVRPALAVAPDLRLSRRIVSLARAAAERNPKIRPLIEKSNEDAIIFRRPDQGGRLSSVECLPASVGGSATRGRRYLRVLLDEAAFFYDQATGARNIDDILGSVAPRTVGQVLVGSTAWSEDTLHWRLYEQNFGNPSTALAARMPTLLVRTDRRVRAMVERERERDPERASREFDCVPLTGGSSSYFDSRSVDRMVDRQRPLVLPPQPGFARVCSVDLGFAVNHSAAVVTYRDGAHIHLAECIELAPSKGQPLQPSAVIKTFAELAKRHGIGKICGDNHYLLTLKEEAAKYGVLAYQVTTKKEEVHAFAKTAIHEGRVTIPYVPRLTAQLKSIIQKPTAGGHLQITAPVKGGAHADLASAFILAVASLESGRNVQPVRRDYSDIERFINGTSNRDNPYGRWIHNPHGSDTYVPNS